MKWRGFRRSIRAEALAAPVDQAPPEPARPGVYRCRSRCGFWFWRDPRLEYSAVRWRGAFYMDGHLWVGGLWHDWAEMDDWYGDCTGGTGLVWVRHELGELMGAPPDEIPYRRA